MAGVFAFEIRHGFLQGDSFILESVLPIQCLFCKNVNEIIEFIFQFF